LNQTGSCLFSGSCFFIIVYFSALKIIGQNRKYNLVQDSSLLTFYRKICYFALTEKYNEFFAGVHFVAESFSWPR